MGRPADLCERLTPRQREVLALVARGKTNFEVAQTLGITLDGAKYHMREIMVRLGCDTRDEAVDIWLARPSPMRRIVLRSTSLLSAGRRSAAVGGAVAAALIVVALVLLLAGQRNESGADAVDGESLRTDPNSDAASAPLAFLNCGTTSFRRPSIPQMALAFGLSRFGDPGTAASQSPGHSVRPRPSYFAYYLMSVYQVAPESTSPTVESALLSGFRLNTGARQLAAPAPGCDSLGDDRNAYFEFWFVDALPTDLELSGGTLTVRVDHVDESITTTVIQNSSGVPTPQGQASRPSAKFDRMIVLGSGGELLYASGPTGTARYSGDGGFVAAVEPVGGGPFSFQISGSPQSVAVYRGGSVAGPATVTDEAGNVWASGQTEQAPDTWVEVFRGELSVGKYTVTGAELAVAAGTLLP